MISTLSLLTTLVIAAAEPPTVNYLAKTESASWEPIALSEVNRVAEGAVLASLTRSGAMRLTKADGFANLKSGDYSVLIQGRFIEEAEQFSVYLTFGPGTKTDLPSFHVSSTASIGRLPRAKMIAKIEAACRDAGQRMEKVAAPQLESIRLRIARPRLSGELPFEFDSLELPSVGSPKSWLQTLLDPTKPDHERFDALAKVKSQVFDQEIARHAVERCVLRDPTPKLRQSCASALEPVARTNVETQRILLFALRTEMQESVLDTIIRISKSFVGLSRQETLDTWLSMISSDATPARAAEDVAQLLSKEGDLPNLDLAVARCLQMESLAYGKKHACSQWLLRNIPEERRPAVVWTYLEEAGRETSEGRLTFEDVLTQTLGRGSDPIEEDLAELLMRIAERPTPTWMRRKVLVEMRRHPRPNPALVERMLRLAEQPPLAITVFDEMARRAGKSPELAGMILGALERIQRTRSYLPQKYGGDPAEKLAKAIEAVKRLHSRRKP